MPKDIRPTISLDVDDCIADFVFAVGRKLGPPTKPGAYTLTEMFADSPVQAKALIHDAEFHSMLPPVSGAVAGVRQMVKSTGAEVCYVSSRLPEFGTLTRAWLWHWRFPQGRVFCVGKTAGSKADCIKAQGASLSIDDNPAALDEIKLLTVSEPVVFDRPWNAGYEAMRMRGWDDWRRICAEAGLEI